MIFLIPQKLLIIRDVNTYQNENILVYTRLDQNTYFQNNHSWDFPGGPVVKTLPSIAGGACYIPGQGGKIPHALQTKNQNIKQKQYCNKFQ